MLVGIETSVPGDADAAPVGLPTSAQHVCWLAASTLLEGCWLSAEEVVELLPIRNGSGMSISMSLSSTRDPVERCRTLHDVACS